MTVDASGAEVTRMVRPPVVNSSPAPQNVATQLVQPITTAVVAGTPAATPTLPALPADTPSSGIFNFPLAYVIVPNGFTSSSSTSGNIQIIAPCVASDGKVSGASRLRPASCMTTDASYLASTAFGLPAQAAANEPILWPLPSSMLGGESLFIALPSLSNTTGPIADAGIVDDSIDWGGRAFLWFAQVTSPFGSNNLSYYPGGFAPSTNVYRTPGCWSGLDGGGVLSGAQYQVIPGMGQSFMKDDNLSIPGMDVGSTRNASVACCLTNNNLNDGTLALGMPSGCVFALYVVAGSPQLRAYVSCATAVNITIWLFATAQLERGAGAY
jgi:hypothetical protein